MSPEPTKTKTSLAVSIRTMGQDFVAVQGGQTPTPRMETVIAGPPEALPVEQLARSPRPIPQPTPIPRQTVQPTPPKPAAPSQLESVLAPKMPLPKPLITPAPPSLAAPRPPVSSILKARIQADLQEAAKRQDAMVTSVLRLLISAIHNAEISQHKETTGLNDNEVRGVIASEVQRRKEAIAGYERGGRGALTEKERTELAVLYHYLPTPPAPPAVPRLPTAPLTQPVKPAFSPPPQPPPPPAAPKPAMPPIAPPKPKPPTALQQAQPPVQKQTIPAVPARPQPTTPQALAVGINRRKHILVSSAIAVIVFAAAGGALWWFKFKPVTVTPLPPPPPPVVIEPTPLIRGMRTAIVTIDHDIDIERTEARDLFEQAFSAPPADRVFETVFVKVIASTTPYFANSVLLGISHRIDFPSGIWDTTTCPATAANQLPTCPTIPELNYFRYGQTEFFPDSGIDRNRYGIVIKRRGATETVPDALRTWEREDLIADLEPYLRISRFGDISNPQWQDSTYRGIAIRYANFDKPDESFDYTFIPTQNLLLITTSRESMYTLIDLVLNQSSIK